MCVWRKISCKVCFYGSQVCLCHFSIVHRFLLLLKYNNWLWIWNYGNFEILKWGLKKEKPIFSLGLKSMFFQVCCPYKTRMRPCQVSFFVLCTATCFSRPRTVSFPVLYWVGQSDLWGGPLSASRELCRNAPQGIRRVCQSTTNTEERDVRQVGQGGVLPWGVCSLHALLRCHNAECKGAAGELLCKPHSFSTLLVELLSVWDRPCFSLLTTHLFKASLWLITAELFCFNVPYVMRL